MTPTQKQARKWINQAITETVDDLVEQWKASQDPAEREAIHAKVTATIELEDILDARIGRHTDE